MEIIVKNFGEMNKIVKVKHGGTTIDMDFLDYNEAEDLAITFLEAIYDLMRGKLGGEEEYYQWLKDNT